MGLIRRTPGVFCFGRAWRRENAVYQHHIGHPVGADSMGAWNRKFLHPELKQVRRDNQDENRATIRMRMRPSGLVWR
jgi:hypothetical protein